MWLCILFADRGITDALTILYIAPEMLRSHTIEKILLACHVVRFVVAWKPANAPKEEPEYAVLLADLKLLL